MIQLFNQAFDVLNSRYINCIDYKKALCNDNIEETRSFINNFTTYIKSIKIQDKDDFIPVLQFNRKTGFIGFIVFLNGLLQLYSTLIESNKLSHIKAYKIVRIISSYFFVVFGPMVNLIIINGQTVPLCLQKISYTNH